MVYVAGNDRVEANVDAGCVEFVELEAVAVIWRWIGDPVKLGVPQIDFARLIDPDVKCPGHGQIAREAPIELLNMLLGVVAEAGAVLVGRP